MYALIAAKQAGPNWPNIGFDFQPVMDRITGEVTRQCPEMEFVVSLAKDPETAKKLVEGDKSAKIDGYLVLQMNCWTRVVQTVAATGKPTLYADFKYGGSGGFLVYTAGLLRNKSPNVGFVASSKMEDLIAAVKCFQVIKKGGSVAEFVAATAKARMTSTPKPGDLNCTADRVATLRPQDCLKQMKESKILAVGSSLPGLVPAITKEMGIQVANMSFAELKDACKAADKDQAKAIADRWQKEAAAIRDVSRETLETSAAMYLAQKALLKKHGANGIAIDCFGGFLGGHVPGYPCLGFHELCNEGLIGACECDVPSAATMVTLTALTQGRPGFISDPVIDTASRQIIYAHCVASKKPFGPQGPANPFQILTHSEDRKGAAVRSTLPLGYMTTTVQFGPDRKQILFHRGKAVANSEDDRACRTKLCVEPLGDLEKLFTEWDQWGWHRVTCYGDLKEPIFALADALGWKVQEEA